MTAVTDREPTEPDREPLTAVLRRKIAERFDEEPTKREPVVKSVKGEHLEQQVIDEPNVPLYGTPPEPDEDLQVMSWGSAAPIQRGAGRTWTYDEVHHWTEEDAQRFEKVWAERRAAMTRLAVADAAQNAQRFALDEWITPGGTRVPRETYAPRVGRTEAERIWDAARAETKREARHEQAEREQDWRRLVAILARAADPRAITARDRERISELKLRLGYDK